MKHSLLRAAFVIVVLAVAPSALGADEQNLGDYVPGQIIVKLKPSMPLVDVVATRASVNAMVVRRFESVGAELWKISGIDVATAVSMCKSDPRIAYAEPDYIMHAEEAFPNEPWFNLLWALHNTGQTGGTPDADIDAPEAWSIETGDSVVVGVIDSGVDWHHVDLAGNIFTNRGEIPDNGIDDDQNGYVDDVRGWDFVNNDNDPSDDNGHGTHIAGTIAAVGNNGMGVVGVSWSARILPVKFLNSGGTGSISNAILAIEYATSLRARLTNNSWGGAGYSEALRGAIESAGNAGILFIATAGGSSSNNDVYPQYPASYDLDNIIAVASTGQNDELSTFSNRGPTSVDLGAPGANIFSTRPGNSYTTMSGTSMATAQVSGALCLLWAAAPKMTHLNAKNAIMFSVDVIPALEGRVVTGGRLNVNNMLRGIMPPPIALDIKPRSCPNALNMKVFERRPGNIDPEQSGVLPTAVLGADDFDVNDIDVSSLRLNGVAPSGHVFNDVAAPLANREECQCWSSRPDGRVDLILKFQTSEVAATLGEVTKGDVIPLKLTGQLVDGVQFETTDCVTIVNDERGGGDILSETEVVLATAVPNPFNPSTTISFTLPARTKVSLSIYDAKGRLVRTLVNDVLEKGQQERSWDGKDSRGKPVSSGVYFYKLTAMNLSQTKKMVLLK